MSYTYSLRPAPTSAPTSAPGFNASTPPAPPPKPLGTSTPTPVRYSQPPPPPRGQSYNEPSELDASQESGHRYHSTQAQPSIPAIESNWLPNSLKNKSTQDLHHFLSTPALQHAFLSSPETTHPAISASEEYLTPIINSNLQLSNNVLALEQKLSALRSQIQQRLLALRALEQAHRQKISETEAALKDFSPMALYQRLNASVQEQDLLVKGVEESWLEEAGIANDREVAEFVRGVKERRKTAFLRRERKGRWDEGRVGGWR